MHHNLQCKIVCVCVFRSGPGVGFWKNFFQNRSWDLFLKSNCNMLYLHMGYPSHLGFMNQARTVSYTIMFVPKLKLKECWGKCCFQSRHLACGSTSALLPKNYALLTFAFCASEFQRLSYGAIVIPNMASQRCKESEQTMLVGIKRSHFYLEHCGAENNVNNLIAWETTFHSHSHSLIVFLLFKNF